MYRLLFTLLAVFGGLSGSVADKSCSIFELVNLTVMTSTNFFEWSFKYNEDIVMKCFSDFGRIGFNDLCEGSVPIPQGSSAAQFFGKRHASPCCHREELQNFFSQQGWNCSSNYLFPLLSTKSSDNISDFLTSMDKQWREYFVENILTTTTTTTTESTTGASTTTEYYPPWPTVDPADFYIADNNGIGATMILAIPVALLLVLVVVFRL